MINGVPRPDIRMRVNRYGQAYFDDPVRIEIFISCLHHIALLLLNSLDLKKNRDVSGKTFKLLILSHFVSVF